MTYTLWHAGVQIGETSFEQTHGRQKIGIFRPTTHGLEVLPRLSGILSAASTLKDEMARCEVEVHDSTGKRVEFKTIAFSDLWELRALCQKLGTKARVPEEEEIPPNGPRYIVSVTLGKGPIPFPRFGMTSRDN